MNNIPCHPWPRSPFDDVTGCDLLQFLAHNGLVAGTTPALPDGQPDLILGTNTLDPDSVGWGNVIFGGIFGTPNAIGGDPGDPVYCSSILGGTANAIGTDSEAVTICGGEENTTSHDTFWSAIVSGFHNSLADVTAAFIGGGDHNSVTGDFGTIPGGKKLTVGANTFGFNTTNTATNISAFSNLVYFGGSDLWLGNVDNTARKVKFFEPNSDADFSSTNYFSFEAQAQAANIECILPAALPSPGDFLKVDTVVGSVVTLIWGV